MGTRFYVRALPLTFGLFAALGCGGDDGESQPSGGPNLGIDGSVPRLDGGNDPTGQLDGDAKGDCRGGSGCFACKPVDNLQHLNSCAEGCQPFDNAKRLPGYQPGQLPPLQ